MDDDQSGNERPPSPPSSELGLNHDENQCESASNNDAKWRLLMEQQNRNFMALIEAMKVPSVNKDVQLPEFNPEKDNAGARAWVTTADMCITDPELQGAPLMMTLSRALKGQASAWLSQVAFHGMTWTNFKDLFTARYECAETSAAFLINLHNGRPKDNECLASYAATLLSSIMSKWKNLSIEQIAVSTVLAHISQFENRVQKLSFTQDITTRNRLQQELSAISFMKRKSSNPSDHNHDAKRPRLNTEASTMKCYNCGMAGHKAIFCRTRKGPAYQDSRPKTPVSDVTPRKTPAQPVTCFSCGAVGHFAKNCPRRSSQESSASSVAGPSQEKRVNVCVINTPAGTLQHAGEQFPFTYDSGAECSLIRESVAAKFRGKRFNNVVSLTGIGQSAVCSTVQISSQIEIDDIPIEVVFHVLPDRYLHYDVMIGREVLALGIAVNMTSDHVTFSRTRIVNLCEMTKPTLDFDSLDTDVPPEYRNDLVELLKTFESSFTSGVPTTRADTDPMTIRLKDPNKTVYRRPYRLSPAERSVVRAKVDELLAANIIRPSSSPFASPILLVKKKDGSDRMCVDYRELNDNTVPDRFPLPLISDQISRLHGARFFTILDMASGFNQIPIHPDSVERTSFITPDGQYEYLAMPFGLRNAPSVFQRAVIKALGDLTRTYVIVYMDDVLIVAKDPKEALERLQVVLKTLTDKGFSLNAKKCSFLKQKVEYLGFEVCQGEIRPNPKKVEALTALPPPETVTQLRQFIGLASYFRQFVPKFSQIMAPLYALTSGNGKLDWKPEHEDIRRQMILTMTNEPVLSIFDPDRETELHTDASAIGYGGILIQKVDGTPHVVAYYSRRTTSAESKYHSYELETLAVVNAVKHFRHFLHGRKFTVVTDCSSLKSARKQLDLTPRVHRWWAFLQSFDFDIVHREGKRMVHADFLSRNPLPLKSDKPFDKVEPKKICVADISKNWLLAEQQRDSDIVKLVCDFVNDKLNEDVAKTYELRSGTLYRKIQRNGKTRCLPVVPRSLRWSIVHSVHEGLVHLGWEKTLEKLYDFYWFENMSKFVRKFVENCVTCRVSKSHSGKIQAELHPIPKVAVPWHTVHIDATGKLSGKRDAKEYVFVLIDAFTKYVLLHHTHNIDTASSIRAVKHSVALFGAPTRLIADQGRCFASQDFRDFCDSVNIKLHLIATGSSRANGQVERVMSTLKNMLTATETSNKSWQDALPDVQLALNCTLNRVTKASPLELLIGRVGRPLEVMLADDKEPDVDIEQVRTDAVTNMKVNADYDKTRFDKTKAKIVPFSVGDFVLLQNEERNQTKLDPKYKGPFKVIEVLENDRYTLKALNSKRTYKYAHDRLRKMPDNDIPIEFSSNSSSSDEENH